MEDVPGLTWWRVLWVRLLLEPSSLLPSWVRYALGVILVAAAGGGAVWLLARTLQPWGVGEEQSGGIVVFTNVVKLLALLVMCWAVLAYAVHNRPTRFRWRNPRPRTADPDGLRALVAEAAELVGWDRPLPVIRLSAWPKVIVIRRFHGGVVKLGVPLLLGLSKEELRVILVRELILSHRVPRRLMSVLGLNSEDLERAARGERFRWRPWLRAHAYRMRRDLWEDTGEMVGGAQILERATWRENLIIHAFVWHLRRHVHTMPFPTYFTDVYRSFGRLLAEDDLLARIAPNVDSYWIEEIDAHERRLTEEFGWKPGRPVDPVTDPALTDLPAKVEHRLGRVLLRYYTNDRNTARRSLPLAETTAEQWLLHHEDQLEQLRAAARAVLGGSHKITDLVRLAADDGRLKELDWWHAKTVCPHPTRAVCVLLPLLQVGLRRQGYVHHDPVRQRLLTGPEGDKVDVVQLAGKIAAELREGGDMARHDPDEDARRLAAESLAGGDATGWFERLYAGSAAGEAVVPWDSGGPHPLLVAWTEGHEPERRDSPKALVVGAGLGDDAEHVAALGYATTAFDVSESAVRLAQERFPGTAVSYQVADLFDPPAGWRRAFDLVVEIMTVQALPEPLHQDAIERIASFVRPGGTLLVIASGRDEGDPAGAPPWPLTRAEVTAFAVGGLGVGEIEDLREPGRRRWRATFHRLTS
ncbi:hypothetical protein GCM10010486_46470 [Nonomuraea roseoviolacea subsp. carminata]